MVNPNWNSFLRMTFSSLNKLWILELKNSLRWFSVWYRLLCIQESQENMSVLPFFFSLKLDQKLSSLLVEIAGLIFMAFFDGKSFDRVFSQMETYFQDGSASHFNTPLRNKLSCQFLGHFLGSNGFQINWMFNTHGNWKNQNLGGRFGATS